MIQSIERGFRVLEILVAHSPSISLREIARESGLPAPSAYRIVQSLVQLGYATPLGHGNYQHGAKLLELAGEVLTSMDYSVHSRPALLQLQEHTPETIHFGILAGDKAQYVDKLEGRRPYRLASVVGMLLTLHCTAIGKSILAFLPDERRAPFIEADRLTPRTANTITTTEAMEAELERIRARGYCLDDEEDRESVRCVGAPVFDHQNQVIGGISVSAPVFNFSFEDTELLAPHLIEAARSTSVSLGAQPAALPEAFRTAGKPVSTTGEDPTTGQAPGPDRPGDHPDPA